MKTLGLIGGMSWESSAQYYRLINEEVRQRLGGAHSAQLLLWSMDFAGIKQLQHEGDWDALGAEMIAAAQRLQAGGAELLVVCTNTMHKLAPQMEAACPLPLLHIADPTATAIVQAGLGTVGLLGTAFTMEEDFYRGRLSERFGLQVLVPDADDRRDVHDIIYRELIAGVVSEASRQVYVEVIRRLVERGAQAIILGCTEIMLLVRDEDSPVPLFDTTTLHARAAVDAALEDLL
ncbi:TPA: aspartate/glutamate racemase family protein [Stenotrophomonas maltophilia]|uniref:aspartate/glutamate racemase family protein n=1 Tax=Stenotrophomonas maltophilia TaxID=40324 RepID=UPI0031B98603|nr:aspartate/glutamate racemase family protein [Stenotrophomonas maltophilia]HDS1041320.1 aspartate/glutamate racemase family protein [Stenotrophomonas maltophilia]HDS1042161.1 aspartate/glutamate racemase family protein [Stenotrophomonas maltophilia]HDS1045682.1 aspartate/glutamate racemase family protein [Stenotrophomonas maltophilia]